jgi:hypothetical protein
MSKIPADKLADECDNVLQHHKTCTIFLGYLDVGWMLDPKHEARIRNIVRKFDVYLVSFHLESVPFAWKNEIDTLYIQNTKNGPSEAINNGRTIHSKPEVEHRQTFGTSSDQ